MSTGSRRAPGARLSVAIKDGYGEDAKTLWVKVTVFGKKAEVIVKHFVKGDTIVLFGNVRMDTFTGRDGNERSALAMTAEDFDFGGGKKNGGSGNGGASQSSGSSSRQTAPARSNSRQNAPAPEEDEVPF